MDALHLEERFGEEGRLTYNAYTAALEPFRETDIQTLHGYSHKFSDYLAMTDGVWQTLLDLDPQPIQHPLTDAGSVCLFPLAINILCTRARIHGASSQLGQATESLCMALRLARKLRESQGPVIAWLSGAVCDYRAVRALEVVLSQWTHTDLKKVIWSEFPRVEGQQSEISDALRAECRYVQANVEDMPLEEAVRDHVKIGWLMKPIDETKESAWPPDESIVDKEQTMGIVRQMFRTEIGWWEHGGVKPTYGHLWRGLPHPPSPGKDPSRFRQVIAGIENPLGKHAARRLSRVFWLARTAARTRRIRLPISRVRYAIRSLMPGELRT